MLGMGEFFVSNASVLFYANHFITRSDIVITRPIH